MHNIENRQESTETLKEQTQLETRQAFRQEVLVASVWFGVFGAMLWAADKYNQSIKPPSLPKNVSKNIASIRDINTSTEIGWTEFDLSRYRILSVIKIEQGQVLKVQNNRSEIYYLFKSNAGQYLKYGNMVLFPRIEVMPMEGISKNTKQDSEG